MQSIYSYSTNYVQSKRKKTQKIIIIADMLGGFCVQRIVIVDVVDVNHHVFYNSNQDMYNLHDILGCHNH